METAASSSRTPELDFLKIEDEVALASAIILSETLTMVFGLWFDVLCICIVCIVLKTQRSNR